jgi:hypothetical protein
VFLGGGLLGMAAVCSSLNFIAGILLVLSWGGFVLYSFLGKAYSIPDPLACLLATLLRQKHTLYSGLMLQWSRQAWCTLSPGPVQRFSQQLVLEQDALSSPVSRQP